MQEGGCPAAFCDSRPGSLFESNHSLECHLQPWHAAHTAASLLRPLCSPRSSVDVLHYRRNFFTLIFVFLIFVIQTRK